MAALVFPVLRWNLTKPAGVVFKPCSDDGAREATDDKFDEHMTLQKESFLVAGQHAVSRRHGKLRTKHDRWAMPMNYLNEICIHYHAENRRLGANFDVEGYTCTVYEWV